MTMATTMRKILLDAAAEATWKTEPRDAGQHIEVQYAGIVIEEGAYELRRTRDLSVAGSPWSIEAREQGRRGWRSVGDLPA